MVKPQWEISDDRVPVGSVCVSVNIYKTLIICILGKNRNFGKIDILEKIEILGGNRNFGKKSQFSHENPKILGNYPKFYMKSHKILKK